MQPEATKKTSCMLGLSAGCFVLAFLAGVACLLAYFASNRSGRLPAISGLRPGAAEPAIPMTRFTANRSDLPESLAPHFVPFSFEYPASWHASGPEGANFVKVEQRTSDGQTIENFAVRWIDHPASVAADSTLYPALAGQLSGQFASQFPNYEKVAEGPAVVAGVRGYELRFRGWAPDESGGRVDFWGRSVLLPEESTGRGVALVMVATSHSAEVRGPDEVGVKGLLPYVLSSFRMK